MSQSSKVTQVRERPRILVAEDHPIIRETTVEFLLRAGYQVDAVENGALAVAVFREKQYDLILMNMAMPGMGGYDASLAIRALEKKLSGKSRRVPIIACTGIDSREECIQAGMDDYLEKPILYEILLSTIAKWLNT